MYFDLEKAKRDLSKLVKVQRTVTKNGKTFTQNFWVQPDKVKKTDKVLQGQQNITDTKPDKGKKSVGFDINEFNSLQSDKTKAIDYLKKNGITWKENSHEGINWMRALMSLKASLNKQQVNKLKSTPKPKRQPDKIKPNGELTDNLIKEVNGLSDGKAKINKLKQQIGNDKCLKLAKDLGVQWKENAHEGINIMRMSMALKDYLSKNQLKDISTKVEQSPATSDDLSQDVDTKGTTQGDVKKGYISYPTNATSRQKAFVDLLNKVDNYADLDKIAFSKVIFEDDETKDFVLNKIDRENRISDNYFLELKSEREEIVERMFDRYLKDKEPDLLPYDDADFRKIMGEHICDSMHVPSILNFRRMLSLSKGTKDKPISAIKFFDVLRNLSTYAGDKHPDVNGLLSNEGILGGKVDALKTFDINKEGIKNAVDLISKNHPELKAKADDIVKNYANLMKLIKCDTTTFSNILSKPYESLTSSISSTTYTDVYKYMSKIFGIKYKDKRTNKEINIGDIHKLTKDDFNNIETYTDTKDAEKACILGNLWNIGQLSETQKNIRAKYDTYNSADLSNDGKSSDGSFNILKRTKQEAQNINKAILQGLEKMPTLSRLDYLSALKHAKAYGNSAFNGYEVGNGSNAKLTSQIQDESLNNILDYAYSINPVMKITLDNLTHLSALTKGDYNTNVSKIKTATHMPIDKTIADVHKDLENYNNTPENLKKLRTYCLKTVSCIMGKASKADAAKIQDSISSQLSKELSSGNDSKSIKFKGNVFEIKNSEYEEHYNNTLNKFNITEGQRVYKGVSYSDAYYAKGGKGTQFKSEGYQGVTKKGVLISDTVSSAINYVGINQRDYKYTPDGTQTYDTATNKGSGMIVVMDAILGDMKDLTSMNHKLADSGYTHNKNVNKAGTLKDDMLFVNNSNQLLPRFLVDVDVTK